MYSSGYGCGSGYVWGDGGIGIRSGYGCGHGYDKNGYGRGDGDGYGYGIGIGGNGRGNDYREDEEEEQLSAIRLLADDHDINFYVHQLYIMKKQNAI